MIQKMKKMQKKDNKGFTLVELIVVLVILAILAAILVPALLGYIDRAKQQQIVLNARSCYTAAQAEMSSMYGKGVEEANLKDVVEDAATKKRILDTADVDSVCTQLAIGTKDKTATDNHPLYTVTYVEYTENGNTIFFNGTSWSETDPGKPSKLYEIKGESKHRPSGS